MADNTSLGAAKTAKNDEFYTQYSDIEAEMNAYVEYNPDVFRDKTILLPCDDPEWSNFTRYFASNFERFGLKKLISTSYAKSAGSQQLTMFESSSLLFDVGKHDTHGKLFTLSRDADGSGNIDLDDIEFSGYLEGDGDFRSKEVCALRDEADIIITNPPFSLLREFLAWILEAGKQFIIIGNYGLRLTIAYPQLSYSRSYQTLIAYYAPNGYVDSYSSEVSYDKGNSDIYWHIHGIGFFDDLYDKFGKIPTGSYTVKLFFNGQSVSSQSFSVNN